MTIEERTLAANVRIMNDQIKTRCFLTFDQFEAKIKDELPGLQIMIQGVYLPIIYNYRKVQGKNYYTDFIKLLFGL